MTYIPEIWIDFAPPMITFEPVESFIIYTLTIILLAGIITDYFTKIMHTKSIIIQTSAFLLLSITMGHLVFIENNTMAETITIVLALILSFISIIIHKILLYIKTIQVIR